MCTYESQAQSTIDRELRFSSLQSDTTLYLGDWIIPTSIEITISDSVRADSFWSFNEIEGKLQFVPDNDQVKVLDQVVIRFSELPYSFPRTYQSLVPREVDSSLYNVPDSLSAILSEPGVSTIYGSDLRQSGSLSRGIIVGSNQDFSLESGLNFELTGALTENIDINASLTDQSIPIQPDGTTQNL
ncbi:MAG TPA: hypothetical protein VJ941_07335, partial [Gracilimonas sp.]|nr:hypothetical protein [Gracilimonas sp.]